MLELLTGTGLASAAGLNAYIPLLALGLLDRFTTLVELPAAMAWLSTDLALWLIGGLLVLELVADKIPAVDSVNDVLQTVIRPAAGGITFASGIGAETVTVSDPTALSDAQQWVPLAIGAAVALVIHLIKAGTRAGANTVSGGMAAPVLSTAEDAGSAALVAAAVFLPVLVAVVLVAVVVMVWLIGRRLRRRRRGAGQLSPEDRRFAV